MLIQIPYNRMYAVEYARKWALSRNPLFTDFSGRGGNCTNFVSQCLLAGSAVMDFTPTFGWYYRSINDRAPAWSGVEQLYGFLTGNGDYMNTDAEGPFAIETDAEIEVGDVIQLANAEGDFYHTLIVSGFDGEGDILVCAQSDDALDRPLSSYAYTSFRVLHIIGVAIEIPSEECFRNLYDAVSLNTVRAIAPDVSTAEG